MSDSKKRVWTTIKIIPPFLGDLSSIVAHWENEHPGCLTEVGQGPVLILASDYGGQHKSSGFETFSFLIADYIYLWVWQEMQQEWRRKYLADGRRMSFKSLNDGIRRRALVPFLRIANSIPGVLFTLAIKKTAIQTLVMGNNKRRFDPLMKQFSGWKLASIGRLALISGVATVLVAGLADAAIPSQHILWLTDEDEILPNETRANDALAVLRRFFEAFVPHQIGNVFWMTSAGDDVSRFKEDMVAIPDMVGGAIAELLSNSVLNNENNGKVSSVSQPLGEGCSEKSRRILDWYGERGHSLARLAVIVDDDAGLPRLPRILDLSSHKPNSPDFDSSFDETVLVAKRLGVYDELMASINKPYLAIPVEKLKQIRKDMRRADEVLKLIREADVRFDVSIDDEGSDE